MADLVKRELHDFWKGEHLARHTDHRGAEAVSETWARELMEHNITVNSVSPFAMTPGHALNGNRWGESEVYVLKRFPIDGSISWEDLKTIGPLRESF